MSLQVIQVLRMTLNQNLVAINKYTHLMKLIFIVSLFMIDFWHEFRVFLVKQLVIFFHFSDLFDIPVVHVLVVHGEHIPHGVPEGGVHSS